jgi:hypothetical protein
VNSEVSTLRRRIEELEEIHRLAQSLSSMVNVYQTLEAIIDCCLKLCHAERGAILLSSGVGKANIYRFSGDVSMVLEEGAEDFEVSFRIEDAAWSGARYHVGFVVGHGTLSKYTSRIELFPDLSQ